jgi:hypothetical protein
LKEHPLSPHNKLDNADQQAVFRPVKVPLSHWVGRCSRRTAARNAYFDLERNTKQRMQLRAKKVWFGGR